jgi:virginiamycin B lyase
MPGYAIPKEIAAGPGGTVWVTEGESGQIARVTPAGKVTEFTAGNGPAGITSGPDGNLWFTDAPPYGDTLGRLTPAGAVQEYNYYPPLTPAGPSGSFGEDIVAADGQLWFSAQEHGASAATEIAHSTTSGMLVGAVMPPGSPTIVALTLGPDGDIWFTQDNPAGVGRIDAAGRLTVISAPFGASDRLAGLATGPDGRVWAIDNGPTASAFARVARIASTGSVSWLTVAHQRGLGGITLGSDGDMWFTTAGALGRITPAGAIATLPVTPGFPAGEIITGPDGNLWFTYPGYSRIGVVSPQITCKVPSVLGLTEQQATQVLNTAFCAVGRVQGHVHGGDVISQSAKPRTQLANGASVDLTFGRASTVGISAPRRVRHGASFKFTIRGRAVGDGHDLYLILDSVPCASDYLTEINDKTNVAAERWPNVHAAFRRSGKAPALSRGKRYLCVYLAVGNLTTARASRAYVTG